jgi:hypothetical protein
MTVPRYCQAEAPRRRQVSMTLARRAKGAGSLFGTGAVTDVARNDPVSQRLFGGVVGERQVGLGERTQDDFPVVEEFAHDTAQGRMFDPSDAPRTGAAAVHLGGVALGQRFGGGSSRAA